MAFVKAGGHVYHAGNFGNDAVWIKNLMAENGIDMRFANIKQDEVPWRESVPRKQRATLINFLIRETVVLSSKLVKRAAITV